MNTALQKKDSDMLERLADMGISRKLLGNYVCDLYKLRGYYVAKETDKFEKTLLHMIDTPVSYTHLSGSRREARSAGRKAGRRFSGKHSRQRRRPQAVPSA